MYWNSRPYQLTFVAFAVLVACGSSDENSGPCPAENPNCKEAATVEQGRQSLTTRKCASCHGDDLSGTTTKLGGYSDDIKLFPPNLTDDSSGLKSWSDEQVATAIRNGIDKEGLQLCPQMSHYPEMNDYEAYSIVKYLRSMKNVSKTIPRSVCPPLKLEGEQ